MAVTLSQGAEFLAALYGGLVMGLLFDIFRLVRLPFPNRRLIHALFDLIFYAAAGCMTAVLLLHLSGGAVRIYHFTGIAIGVFCEQYFLTRPILACFRRIAKRRKQNLQKKSAAKAGKSKRTANKNKE